MALRGKTSNLNWLNNLLAHTIHFLQVRLDPGTKISLPLSTMLSIVVYHFLAPTGGFWISNLVSFKIQIQNKRENVLAHNSSKNPRFRSYLTLLSILITL